MFSEESWAAYMRLVKERPWEFVQDSSLEIILDKAKVIDFSERTGTQFGVVYESDYNLMVVDLVRSESGKLFPYERLLPASTGSSVVIVPVKDGCFLLLEQFRHALRTRQLAFPRGFGENGLSAAENAEKELFEELGASVASSEVLGKVVANSGISGDETFIVLCEIAHYEPKIGHEGIEGAICLTPSQMREWISCRRITDGYTLAAWSLVEACSPAFGTQLPV